MQCSHCRVHDSPAGSRVMRGAPWWPWPVIWTFPQHTHLPALQDPVVNGDSSDLCLLLLPWPLSLPRVFCCGIQHPWLVFEALPVFPLLPLEPCGGRAFPARLGSQRSPADSSNPPEAGHFRAVRGWKGIQCSGTMPWQRLGRWLFWEDSFVCRVTGSTPTTPSGSPPTIPTSPPHLPPPPYAARQRKASPACQQSLSTTPLVPSWGVKYRFPAEVLLALFLSPWPLPPTPALLCSPPQPLVGPGARKSVFWALGVSCSQTAPGRVSRLKEISLKNDEPKIQAPLCHIAAAQPRAKLLKLSGPWCSRL